MFRAFRPLLLLVLLCGCTHGTVHRRLSAIDSLTEQHYDSALLLLRQMDTLPMRRADRMYLELLRGKAMNKADSLFTTDSLMRRVVRYYDRHGSRNRRMLAHYVLGCAYRDMQSAPRALEQYQQAIDVADTTAADCDLNTLMRVHSQMADLYLRMHLYEDSHREDSIAQRLAWQIGDTLSALRLEEYLCNYLYTHERYEECIISTKELYAKYLSAGYPKDAMQACLMVVKSYFALGEYEKAKPYLNLYESCTSAMTDSRKINGGFGTPRYYKGKHYLGIGRLDSAEFYFRSALPYIHLRNNALLLYKGLSDVYALQHKADSVLKYTTLYTDEKERRYNESMGQTTLQLSAVYDYSVEQRIANEQRRKAFLWKYLSLVFLFVCTIVGFYLWKKKERVRHLNRELRRKTQELIYEVARVNEDAAQKDERIIKLKGQMEYLCHELKDTHTSQEETLLSQSDIAERFRRTLTSPNEPHLDQQDWNRLAETVNRCHPTFLPLIHGGKRLNTNEQRLCMLLLCGFKPFQIDDLMGMKHTFASQTRQRLHKKVFGTEGTAADFDRKLQLLT